MGVLAFLCFAMEIDAETNSGPNLTLATYVLSYNSQTDPALQRSLESLDDRLRGQFGMQTNQTAVGLLDLRTLRLAMVRPDAEDYAASVAKIGILLAYFQLHPEAATNLDASTRHELGLMAKVSSNEMAAKFSRQLGLKYIQQTLYDYHLYTEGRRSKLWDMIYACRCGAPACRGTMLYLPKTQPRRSAARRAG